MKYAALALEIGPIFGGSCPFCILDKNHELALFDNEKQALSLIKKLYSDTTILIGMIVDPTSLYQTLKAEHDTKLKAHIDEQRAKEKVKKQDKKTSSSTKKTTKILKNPKESNKKTK